MGVRWNVFDVLTGMCTEQVWWVMGLAKCWRSFFIITLCNRTGYKGY